MSSDEEAQQDEMLAMESIFDGETFKIHDGDIRSGQIKIRLETPDPFFVEVLPGPGEQKEELELALVIPGITIGTAIRYRVQFLPPLTLHFTLPVNYPSQTKPNFTLSSTWLHRAALSILCQKLDELWEENKGMGILYSWTNYLQANTLADLGITDFYDVAWLTRPVNITKRNPYFRAALKRKEPSAVTTTEEHLSTKTLNTSADFGSGPVVMDADGEVAGTSSLAYAGIASATPDRQGSETEDTSKAQRGKKRGSRLKSKLPTPVPVLDQRAATDTASRVKDGKEIKLIDYMLAFNEEQIRETFMQSSHSCDICFTIKIGHACVRFRCGHVFCEDCVTGFFATNITEGTVDQVKCLAFNCKMLPSPELVKRLLGEALYDRYDQILLKRALENMSDITYCPRPKCHNPVICDPNEKCASCTLCGYTFCSICKMVYHGVEPCRFKDVDMKDVFKKFTEGTPAEKKALVKAYGEKQLKVLVENVLSEQWIQKESKQCPHCKVPIEKFEGCNKVTCFKCNTYFCWICLTQLEQGNPYFHFNDPSSKCYNNLFQDVNDDNPMNGWIHNLVDDETDTSDDDDDFDDDIDFFDSDSDIFDDYLRN